MHSTLHFTYTHIHAQTHTHTQLELSLAHMATRKPSLPWHTLHSYVTGANDSASSHILGIYDNRMGAFTKTGWVVTDLPQSMYNK